MTDEQDQETGARTHVMVEVIQSPGARRQERDFRVERMRGSYGLNSIADRTDGELEAAIAAVNADYESGALGEGMDRIEERCAILNHRNVARWELEDRANGYRKAPSQRRQTCGKQGRRGDAAPARRRETGPNPAAAPTAIPTRLNDETQEARKAR